MYTEPQKTLHSQSKLGENKKAGDIMPPDFRLYYKAVVIKTAWYRQKNRHTDRRELRNKPIHLQSISLGQGGKNTQWGKDSLFNKWCWGNWTATCKRMKLGHFLTTYTKVNSKWIIDLNIKPEIAKLLEENTSSILFDIGLSRKKKNYISPQLRETKAKVNKEDYKLKIPCAKRPFIEQDEIFASAISDKRLIPKIYKELIQLNLKK